MAFAKVKKPVYVWLEQERSILPRWAYSDTEWAAISKLSERHFVKLPKPLML